MPDVFLVISAWQLNKHGQYSQREFDKVDFGITIDQWILLKIIQETTPLSQKELAQKSMRDPASITRSLDLLARKQYIHRVQSPENRRQYDIQLTNEGARFVQKWMPMVKKQRRQSIQNISAKELKLLSDILLKIQNNMQ